MKRITVCFLLVCTLFCGNVYAADVPVKKIHAGDKILLLSESGNLLLADTVTATTKKLLYKNVIDFKLESNLVYDEYSGYTTDGKIFHITIGNSYERFDISELNADIKTPVNLADVYNLIYIDSSNNLIKHNGIDNEKTIILENIQKATDTYAITTDNCLYLYDSSTNETKFIMSEVCDTKNISYLADIALKQNGELYLLNQKGNNKIASNISSISDDKFYNTLTHCLMIDKNNSLYGAHSLKYNTENVSFQKMGDDFSKILDYNTSLHAIDNNGKLYYYTTSNELKIENEQLNDKKVHNVIPAGYKNFFLTDKGVYINNQNNAISLTTSIKDVIYKFPDCYIYLYDNGEVWASDDKFTSIYKTPLSDKSTILKINDKIVELKNSLQIVDDRTMYPFRECLEIMNASVQWDGENKIAIGELPGIKIEFPIGKSEYYINGVRHEMDTKAYVDESIGRTYIPIRYAAEGLGFTVDWIEGELENTIDIHK